MTADAPAHVHGRFQPFHDEHLEYVRWAARDHDGDRVVVGITNADDAHTRRTEADSDRHRPRNNPFTYYERCRMIRETLDGADLGCAVSVAPFPINRPGLWDAYAPKPAIHYVNVLEPWHDRKVELLETHGRTVEHRRGTRTMSGTEIRRNMAAGGPWADRVPEAVAAYVRERDLTERVKRLYADGEDP